MTSEAPTLEALTARIRAAFPQLPFKHARLIGHGDDNLVVVLDDKFAAELNLLAKLTPLSPIPLPHYEYVSEERDFGVYQQIQGQEMTSAVFAAMPSPDQRKVLS